MPRQRVKIIKPRGRKFYVMRWTEARTGIPRQKSAKTTRRKVAYKAADELAEQLDQGVSRELLAWCKFCHRYETERQSALKPKTRTDWKTASKVYGELMSPETIQDLTASEISEFAGLCRKNGKTESRLAKYLGEIRRATKWAAKMRFIDAQPYIYIPSVARDSDMHGRPLTAKEFKQILSAAAEVVGADLAQSWEDTIYKYWLSGFRRTEALDVWWDRHDRHHIVDIDAEKPKISIRAHFEKGKKNRRYPLPPDFADYLRLTPKKERTGPVFNPHTRRGPTRNAGTVGRTIADICERAGIVASVHPVTGKSQRATLHDFRRSFGTRWAPLVKPFVLQNMMRHKTITTTEKYYIDLDSDTMAEEIWKAYGTGFCDPIGNPELCPTGAEVDTD